MIVVYIGDSYTLEVIKTFYKLALIKETYTITLYPELTHSRYRLVWKDYRFTGK